MSVDRSVPDAAGTITPARTPHGQDTEIDTRYVRTMVRLTAMIGGPLFLLTVILHPARDGHDIAAHAEWYAFTHFVMEGPPTSPDALGEAVELLTDLWIHAVYGDTLDV